MIRRSRTAVFHGAAWIVFAVLISGCVTLPPRFDRVKNSRFTRVAVKMRTPTRIISGLAGIYWIDDCGIQMEIADPVGITRSCLRVNERSIRWADLNDQCWSSMDGWVNRLSQACGVSLKCSQILEWILPSEWPLQPRSFVIDRPGNLKLEIQQFPPSADELGRVIVRIPGNGLEISLNWLEPDRTGWVEKVQGSLHDEWVECDDSPGVMDWIR